MRSLHAFIITSVFLSFIFSTANAAYVIPYTTRTKDYSPWTPAPRGEINNIGMAGATISLPYNISSSEYNPAGVAMTMSSLSAQINNVTIYDKRIQKNDDGLDSNQAGVAVVPPPWGFSFAYYSTMKEGGSYIFPSSRTTNSEVALGEYQLTVAHTWFQSRLGLGASLKLAKATREIGGTDFNSMGLSYRIGALYRLEDRVILGFSYAPEITIDADSNTATTIDLPGFNRAIHQPSQWGLGIGWIPNRFFKLGFGLHRIGSTPSTALLADETKVTGANATVVPRLGASYVLAEYDHLKIELAMGTYYEASRISGEQDRLHGTLGFEVMPYFVNTGIGFDLSKDYRNFILSFGINVIKTMRTFDIIPEDPLPARNKFWPDPFEPNPDGLAPGLTKGEQVSVKEPSLQEIKKIVKDIPKNVSQKLKGEDTEVEKKEKQQDPSKAKKK